MSIVINGIKMPEVPDEMIELAILGDGTVIQTGESWRSPEDGKCYWTVTNPEKFGNAVSIPKHGDLIDRDALPTSRVEWEDIINAPVVIPADVVMMEDRKE